MEENQEKERPYANEQYIPLNGEIQKDDVKNHILSNEREDNNPLRKSVDNIIYQYIIIYFDCKLVYVVKYPVARITFNNDNIYQIGFFNKNDYDKIGFMTNLELKNIMNFKIVPATIAINEKNNTFQIKNKLNKKKQFIMD